MQGDPTLKIRRQTKDPFARVPHAFARGPGLSDKAFRLWVVLLSHADWDAGDCHLYLSTIGGEMNCSKASVWRAQTELVGAGLLIVESGQAGSSANNYVVVDPVDKASRPRDTSLHPRDEGIAPTRHKENENPYNKKDQISPGALRPGVITSRRSGPTDFSDADPNVSDRVNEIRESLKANTNVH